MLGFLWKEDELWRSHYSPFCKNIYGKNSRILANNARGLNGFDT
jgi:hypothetical protein